MLRMVYPDETLDQAQRWTGRPSTNPHFRGTSSFAGEKPGGEHERRYQVSKRHRNPHERSGEGLVFERRKAEHSRLFHASPAEGT